MFTCYNQYEPTQSTGRKTSDLIGPRSMFSKKMALSLRIIGDTTALFYFQITVFFSLVIFSF